MELDLFKIGLIIGFLIICNILAYKWYTSKWWNVPRGNNELLNQTYRSDKI